MLLDFIKPRRICQMILAILFPPRCAGCDRILSVRERKRCFCTACGKKAEPAMEPLCKKCGKPIADPTGDLCGDCRFRNHSFRMGRAAYVYSGPVRPAMYRFKYDGRKGLARAFARELAMRWGPWVRRHKAEAVLCVPMFEGKRRVRGYDQAGELARELAVCLDLPFEDGLVVRTRDTEPQKNLGAYERRKNLKRSFKFVKNSVKYSRVIIVDDIYTTGASVDAVAAVLTDAGVDEVYFLTFAIGRSPT